MRPAGPGRLAGAVRPAGPERPAGAVRPAGLGRWVQSGRLG